jgi:hypothetical protein
MSDQDPTGSVSLPPDLIIEEVDVDDDVSAADLTGEAHLPTSEISLPPDEASALIPSAIPDEITLESTTGATLPPTLSAALPPTVIGPPADPPLPPLSPQPEPLIEADTAHDTGEHTGPSGIFSLPGEVLLVGQIAAMPLLDLLDLLGRQAQTGVLQIDEAPASEESAQPGRHVTVVLERGRVAQATALGFPELRLGEFLRQSGVLDDADIESVAALARVAPTPAPLGLRLCQVGLLHRDDLHQALSQQTRAILYAVLAFSAGRFVLSRPDPLPRLHIDPAQGAALGLDLQALLLEGYRRRNEWHLCDRDATEGAVYLRTDADLRPGAAERLGLSREELAVLSLCSGKSTLFDIAKGSRLAPPAALRVLQRLQAIHLVRRRLPPLAV